MPGPGIIAVSKTEEHPPLHRTYVPAGETDDEQKNNLKYIKCQRKIMQPKWIQTVRRG